MTVVVLANPTAGRGRAGTLIGRVVAQLRALGIEHRVEVSESAEDLERLARSSAEDGAEIVAVLGGDGSVGAAANGLVGTGAALSVLPAGTGDDFAKAIGPAKLDEATRLLAVPNIRAIDLVQVTAGAQRRCVINIAGAGFDSEVNETANAMKIRLGSTGTAGPTAAGCGSCRTHASTTGSSTSASCTPCRPPRSCGPSPASSAART
jgi:diacylglycerol kinase (ATP)